MSSQNKPENSLIYQENVQKSQIRSRKSKTRFSLENDSDANECIESELKMDGASYADIKTQFDSLNAENDNYYASNDNKRAEMNGSNWESVKSEMDDLISLEHGYESGFNIVKNIIILKVKIVKFIHLVSHNS